MLQAWIVSPRESLYFAAEATPCNLAALRRHVRRMQRHLRGHLRLSLSFGDLDVGVGVAGVSAFLPHAYQNPGTLETVLHLTMTYAGDWVEDTTPN